MTLLYALCVIIAWIPGENTVSHDVYEDMIFAFNTTDTQFKACRLGYYVDTTFYVVGVNSEGTGEPSETLTVQWVWDFDTDEDGVIGFSDFGYFIQAFTTYDPAFDTNGDGWVSILDFGRFQQRWGECNDGVKVVPC